MKDLRELLKKLEAMTLEEFNEKIAIFIKNSEKMNQVRNLVKDFQHRFSSGGWQALGHDKINYEEKIFQDPDKFNHFNGELDWKNHWGDWQHGKDSE